MSGIQHSSLSDEEFERAVYMALGAAGTLPTEVAKELAQRNALPGRGRDWEKFEDRSNSKQQPLPFDTK
jgi:hypothetical protein